MTTEKKTIILEILKLAKKELAKRGGEDFLGKKQGIGFAISLIESNLRQIKKFQAEGNLLKEISYS